MNRSKTSYLFIMALVLMLFSAAAHADSIGITLTQINQTGVAGRTVTFQATLTNLTTNTIFLNGNSGTTSSTLLTVDDNPFLTNAPLTLAPGASSGPFDLFSVLIAPGTSPGVYGFNTFSILGGLDGNAFDPIGSADFDVTVSPVPEPGTIVLLTSGLLGLGIKRRRGRKNS